MEQRRDASQLTTLQTAEDTPLRRYLATLREGEEAEQLLRQIGVFLHYAGVDARYGGRDVALEVLQESVVEALRSEDRFDAGRRPQAWLLGIANKVVLRVRERIFRQNKHEQPAGDWAAAEKHGDEALSEDEIFDRLVAMKRAGPEDEVLAAVGLEELLGSLGAEDRRIVELSVLHEMSGAEIAGALDISPGAARVRLFRALGRLRATLKKQEAGQEEMERHE